MELMKGKSLKNLIANASFRLSPKSLVFKHLIKEIYLALRDLHQRCTYTLKGKLTVKNIFVADHGTKYSLWYLINILESISRTLDSVIRETISMNPMNKLKYSF